MQNEALELFQDVHTLMLKAEMYMETLEQWDKETSDPIEYENYFNTIDRIWNILDESRELGENEELEDNDEILEAWEETHRKACEIMDEIQTNKLKSL